MRTKPLFPEMEREIRDDRKAERREAVQHARNWLKKKDASWLINHLLEHGPRTELSIMFDVMEEEYQAEEAAKKSMEALLLLHGLCITRKLWRRSQGIHDGSGEESFLYGIRGVHPLPNAIRRSIA